MEKRVKVRNILLVITGIAVLSFIILLLIFSFTPRVVSTTHVTLAFTDFDTFLDESTLIVHGRVEGKNHSYTDETNGDVYTDYYISPIRTFRGEAAGNEEITIRLNGGTIGNAIYEYPQEAKLEIGEEYLFIANTPVNNDLTIDESYYRLNFMMCSAWKKVEDNGVYFESLYHLIEKRGTERIKRGTTEINGQGVQTALVSLSVVEEFSEEVNTRIPPEETLEKLKERLEEHKE